MVQRTCECVSGTGSQDRKEVKAEILRQRHLSINSYIKILCRCAPRTNVKDSKLKCHICLLNEKPTYEPIVLVYQE